MDEAIPPLTAFMPHRAPMLLLDALTACSDTEAVCTKTFREGDLFVEDGEVSALVVLELFAQAAAAHFGYLGLKRGGGFASGALLGTRKLELRTPRLTVGEALEVRVTQVMSMPPAAQYQCALVRAARADGGPGAAVEETIAEGTINVAMGQLEER
jgi:predicted hotdog family 3-hydroxylacyl-ACP dehydratase